MGSRVIHRLRFQIILKSSENGMSQWSNFRKGSSPRVSSRVFALAVVGLMILAAFVFVAPALMSPAASVPAGILAPPMGDREVTYTLSPMGESYLKDSSTSALGKHGSTPGVSEWWPMRTTK